MVYVSNTSISSPNTMGSLLARKGKISHPKMQIGSRKLRARLTRQRVKPLSGHEGTLTWSLPLLWNFPLNDSSIPSGRGTEFV